MNDFRIASTSQSSAVCTDIVLRETGITRLIFRPLLVKNPNEPDASIKGSFVFQRKSQAENWADISAEPLSRLKSGEGYKLALSSSETRRFFGELSSLYKVFDQDGIPRGEIEYVRASSDLAQLAKLGKSDLRRYLDADRSVGSNLISKLLNWAIELDDPEPLVDMIVSLKPTELRKLNSFVGTQVLKVVLSLWEDNSDNSDEEFWQDTLTTNSFVLEQLFSWPCTIVKDKAYVGGKQVSNTQGRIVDYLMKNDLTDNAALVEIKTPATKLIGGRYRGMVPNASSDLTGSILQVLDYKNALEHSYSNLVEGNDPNCFRSFDPRCILIIGRVSSLASTDEIRSFELLRNQLSNVLIVTYDELFGRIRHLVDVLETTPVVEPSAPS